MSTAKQHLTVVKSQTALTVWDDSKNLEQIKQIFAPKLNDLEFRVFCEMGKATTLNPFLREIWCVKYDERAPAQIFIGRDGYRKSAQSHPLYDYHLVDAIYSNDEFEVINGIINHRYKMTDRGTLLGAYCVVKRKGATFPTHIVVDIKEYSTGKSLWGASGKPATMIKKVAEAQALRSAFQELFGGSYHEDEEWKREAKENPTKVNDHVNNLLNEKSSASASGSTYTEASVESLQGGEDDFITAEQLDTISVLMGQKPLESEFLAKILEYLGVERIEDMDAFQAKRFIQRLQRD